MWGGVGVAPLSIFYWRNLKFPFFFYKIHLFVLMVMIHTMVIAVTMYGTITKDDNGNSRDDGKDLFNTYNDDDNHGKAYR